MDTQNCGLDPQIDVLGHQGNLAARMILLQGQGHAEDIVIRGIAGQRNHRTEPGRAGLKIQSAPHCRFAVWISRAGQRQTLLNLVLAGAGDQIVQKAASLPNIARHFRNAFLGAVQLFQHLHRQVNIVFLKAEQRSRIVHQHIGVEDK